MSDKTQTAQHTPGPWLYQAGRVYIEGGRTIALVKAGELLAPGAIQEHDANTRLIAQAPAVLAERAELLAALRESQRLLCLRTTADFWCDEVEPVAKRNAEVLAKAERGQE